VYFFPETALSTLRAYKAYQFPSGQAPWVFGGVTVHTLFSQPEGRPGDDWDPGYWTLRGVHPPGTFMLAMLYLYEGQTDTGLDLARRVVSETVQRGWMWDWAVVLDGSEGPRIGTDYYQNMMLWSLPAVISGGNIKTPCQPGGLVYRVIQAGSANRFSS
jgi:hypothetical protein